MPSQEEDNLKNIDNLIKSSSIDVINGIIEMLDIKNVNDASEYYKILSDIIELSSNPVCIYDNTALVYVNDAAVKIYGFDNKDDMLKVGENEYFAPVSDKIENYKFNIKRKNGRCIELFEETFVRTLDNKFVDIETTVKSINHSNGNIYLCIGKDISNNESFSKEYYQEDAYGYSPENKDKKMDFFIGLAHDLRTPLNIIYGSVQMLRIIMDKEVEDEKRKKCSDYIEYIVQNTYRLTKIINNMIEVSKLDGGYEKLKLTNGDIIKFVEDITMSVAEYAKDKSIEIIFDTDVEELDMGFDSTKIESVMMNLLSNAIKFSPKGGHIFVNCKECNSHISISVRDEGIGISRSECSRLFKSFSQVNNEVTRTTQGSGIGLMIVKSFIEMHKGTIKVNSQKGNGSEFVVTLPTNLSDDKQLEQYEEKAMESNTEKLNIEFSDVFMSK